MDAPSISSAAWRERGAVSFCIWTYALCRRKAKGMGSSLEGKRTVVLGDNDLLCRAIGLSLNGRLKMEIVETGPALPQGPDLSAMGNHLDLIVVAMSSPDSEPLLALVRASLAERVGHTPVLIISERPFEARPGENIAHLGFPFRPDELHDKVRGILDWAWTPPSGPLCAGGGTS
jgi:hypothetical protein